MKRKNDDEVTPEDIIPEDITTNCNEKLNLYAKTDSKVIRQMQAIGAKKDKGKVLLRVSNNTYILVKKKHRNEEYAAMKKEQFNIHVK